MEKSKKDLKPKDFFNFHWIREKIPQKIYEKKIEESF
jgi:hypothetical protein